MKKISLIIASLFLLVTLVGCGANTTKSHIATSSTESSQKAKIEIIGAKTITGNVGENLLDTLKSNVKVVESKGFITSINGKAQDAKKNLYWMYKVNGKVANVGAGDYKLKSGDKVEFYLGSY
jgi:hypothetical protein